MVALELEPRAAALTRDGANEITDFYVDEEAELTRRRSFNFKNDRRSSSALLSVELNPGRRPFELVKPGYQAAAHFGRPR